MKFVKATVAPSEGQWAPDTFYMISEGANLIGVYVTDAAGAPRHIAKPEEVLSSVVAFSDVTPALDGAELFWWDTVTGSLFIKYNDGTTTAWIEAIPSVAIPEFAGTGEAVTMARSDHWHEGVKVQQADW